MCAALAASGLALGAASGTPAHAQSARAVPVDTTGQTLATALTDLARRSGRELLLATPSLGDRAAPRLRGRFTIDQALPLLLAGSGLNSRRTLDGSYIIQVAPAAPAPGAEPNEPVALPELLVTGRRSQNSDIQRYENDIQAYKVWNSRDIEQAHSADINDFLRLKATGDTLMTSARQSPVSASASNRSEVNLRGLGSSQTLVLVDGHRMPGLPSGLIDGGLSVAQPDLNGIPLAAIDRVEVLNSTAGGLYGAGATAGAVNIVLKRDYSGADLGVTYGITARGDAPATRIDGRIGFTPDDGRTEVMIAFGRAWGSGLSVGDRDFTARARAQRAAKDPAASIAETAVSGSVNIFSLSGAPLSLDPAYGGTSLGAASTFAPASYGGASTDGGALLLANAGQHDIGLSPDASGVTQGLLTQPTVSSLIGSVRHAFGASIEAYADLLVLRNEGQATIPEAQQQAVVSASAPTNPFQQDVLISYPLPGFDAVTHNRAQTLRSALGVIADLPHGWKLNADGSFGGAKVDTSVTGKVFTADFMSALLSGQASASGGTIDPLAGRKVFLQDLTAYTTEGRTALSQVNHFRDLSLRLAGPVVDLAGGPLEMSLLAEARRDSVPISKWTFPDIGYPAEDQLTSGVYTSTRSYAAELRAPLTDRYAGPAGLKGLEVQLAVRREMHREGSPQGPFDTVALGSSTTVYTGGFKVFPLPSLMIRASAASGFLPPDLNMLGSYTATFTSDADVFAQRGAAGLGGVLQPVATAPKDPLRGGEPLGTVAPYAVVYGGSTRLQPEQARSLSAGAVLTPSDRFRVSIDYTRIDKRREIATFHTGDVSYFLAHEAQYPDRVTRAPLTADDRAKGYAAGVVTAVDTTSMNIGKTVVEAVDLQGDYLIPMTSLGDFRLHAAATWQPRLTRQSNPDSEVIDYVGYADGPLAWRANGGADWTRGATTAGFNIVFYDSYRVFNRLDAPDAVAAEVLQQGAARIPAQVYLDLFASRRVTLRGGTGGLREIQVRFGIQNLLDHAPPLVVRSSQPTYSTYGDPRGRRFELSLVGHF